MRRARKVQGREVLGHFQPFLWLWRFYIFRWVDRAGIVLAEEISNRVAHESIAGNVELVNYLIKLCYLSLFKPNPHGDGTATRWDFGWSLSRFSAWLTFGFLEDIV